MKPTFYEEKRMDNMTYKIYCEDIIKRTNSVIIETESEEQGEMIANKLNENASNYDHPDCIILV